jgi:hypothetical protein
MNCSEYKELVSIPVRGSGKSKALTPEALWNQGYK